jgi:hypothetical protein
MARLASTLLLSNPAVMRIPITALTPPLDSGMELNSSPCTPPITFFDYCERIQSAAFTTRASYVDDFQASIKSTDSEKGQ